MHFMNFFFQIEELRKDLSKYSVDGQVSLNAFEVVEEKLKTANEKVEKVMNCCETSRVNLCLNACFFGFSAKKVFGSKEYRMNTGGSWNRSTWPKLKVCKKG